MSATEEEKALIKAALRWHRYGHPGDDTALHLAAQAVVISRRPAEGPAPIPCMERAMHSAVMFCHLPKGHPDSEPIPTRPGRDWAFTYHQGVAAGGKAVRNFNVQHQLINGVWERVNTR